LKTPEKYTLTLAWIADAGTPSQYIFVLNGRIAYKTIDGLEHNLSILPKGSNLIWDPGCERMGGEPLLSSEIEMKKFKMFCDSIGIKFTLVPSG
jgi:hypothetical protein